MLAGGLLYSPCWVNEARANDLYENSRYRRIARQNLQTLEWEEDEGPSTDLYHQFLEWCMKTFQSPQPLKKRKCAFEIMGAIKAAQINPNAPTIDAKVWEDLEILRAQQNMSDSPNLAFLVDRTQTDIGRVNLIFTLANPTSDIPTLLTRQAAVQELVNNAKLLSELTTLYQELGKREGYILSFWYKQDPMRQQIDTQCFYKLKALKQLDSSIPALEFKNRFTHIKNIFFLASNIAGAGTLTLQGIYGIKGSQSPAFITTMDNFFGRSEGETNFIFRPIRAIWNQNDYPFIHHTLLIASGIYCGLNTREMAEWTRDLFFLDECLQRRMIEVANYLKYAKKIAALAQKNPVLAQAVPELKSFEILIHAKKQSKKLRLLLQLLGNETFKNSPSIFHSKGQVLVAYKYMMELHSELDPIFEALGAIETYVSTARLYQEHKNTPVHYAFPSFIESATPSVAINNCWNPFISPTKVVPNTIELGNAPHRRNALITGPNTGGKSTALKSIATSLILGQTLGIVAADAAEFTPFTKIGTHLNITDNIASGNSLFKSEVLRAHDLIKMINTSGPTGFCFIIMDELFNGTTPVEGQAAAFSFAKHIGEAPNTICMIATHFDLLTHLTYETDFFQAYSLGIKWDKDKKIIHTFKLTPGVSKQHIALDILAAEGFPSALLDEAREIVEKTACI
jgi:DNA mismatch repair protein MutS